MRAALLLFATGCSIYTVHRAALAPHAEPVVHPAEPMDTEAELGLGASSVAHVGHIGEGNPNAAVEVPGTQFRGDARLAVSDDLVIGAAYEEGLAATSQQEKSTQPPVDEGDVRGYGVEADVAVPTRDPALRIGLHVDVTTWRVPYVEWKTCIDICPFGPYTIQTRGHGTIGTFGVGVTPSYRTGTVTWFGGLTAKQHPTIQEKGTELAGDLEDDVRAGPFNLLVSAGAEVALGGDVKGTVVLYQDLTQDPVSYRPSLAAMVIVPIGSARPRPPVSTSPLAGDPPVRH